MAEQWTKAFGRYLRVLRERQKLSLHDVSSLSQAFAETLNKGYLSRCENGLQRLALSKVIPLSRIYGVSADALLERIELDIELERIGGPETEGLGFSELTEAGISALNEGFRWNAYGYLRDATTRATVDPVRKAFRNAEEQLVCAHKNCATAARGLGRLQFALHEYLFVKDSGATGPKFLPTLLERLSQTYRGLNQLEVARGYAEQAIEQAESHGEVDYLGYIYANRASQAYADSDLETAAAYYQQAYRAYRHAKRLPECARSLNNLAQIYFDLGRFRASRRSVLAAERVMRPLQQHRTRALGRILMGELDAVENDEARAENHWREAVTIAKRINDKVIRFKAEYLLFKQADKNGNEPVARAIRRRLRRLSNWVPRNTPELKEFEKLRSKDIA